MKNFIPRQEHPHPQFMRKSWQNLNGEWFFEIDQSRSGTARKLYETETLSGKITVPFCPESSLSGVENKDFLNAVWYKKNFEIAENNKRVLLHFGAVDYKAVVYVNGRHVGEHKGGYTPFCFEITEFVKNGNNVITLYAEDDVRSSWVPRGKQSEEYYSHGCDYTRTTGIWQTVWLEFVPESYIKDIKIFPDYKNGTLGITATVDGNGVFEATAFFDGIEMGSLKKQANGESVSGEIKLSEIHPWEVGNGRLYDLKLSFGEDEVSSYFGLRSLRLEGYKFLINEKSVFQRLVLDQGFYKNGIYTAPSDEALENDIRISIEAGFNGARLHQKIFEPRFLYHCDRLGYIVWGEYPNWGIDYSDPNALFSVLPEWCEAVNRDFNNPSIVGWCPFNETWDYAGRVQNNELLRIIYKTTKMLDSTRPCIDTSGNYHVETDIYDVHDYNQNPEEFAANYFKLVEDDILHDSQSFKNGSIRQSYNGQPVFVSEYGGIKWAPEDEKGAWGYGNAPTSEEEFISRYKGLTDALLDNEKMFGFCYTQLYDIEQEQNGLYTYDRAAKFDMNIFKEINERKAAIE